MPYETPIVPCKHFEIGIGCKVWCNKGDTDCCVLCCQRNKCNDKCPKAEKLLELPEFKDKRYAWE